VTQTELYTIQPLDEPGKAKMVFNPHRGQEKAWDSASRFVLVLAGNQSGKTVFGPMWLYREIQKRGPGDYLAVSVNYDLFKLKMLPAMQSFFVHSLGWTYAAGDKIIANKTGDTRIILRSAAAEGSLESSTALAAWADEWGQDDVEITHWEALLRRVGRHQGRVLITTTPYNLGWLKVAFYDRWKGGDTNYDVINFRTIDNPTYPLEEYNRAKATMPDWRFRMFYDGEFTKPAGLIYQDYNDSYGAFEAIDGKPGPGRWTGGGHLVKPFSIPDFWIRDFGADLGPVHCAKGWAATDPETGNHYIYRAMMDGGKNGAEQARDVREYKEQYRYCIGGTSSEDERRLEWQLGGLPLVEGFFHDVEAGIDHAIGLFKTNQLFIFDTLTGLRSDLGAYSRELDDAGEPTAKIKDKQKFHFADMLRYLVSYWPLDATPGEKAPQPPAEGTERTVEFIEWREQQFRPIDESEDYL
jgi:hypothetical protein